jgi:TonB family protein
MKQRLAAAIVVLGVGSVPVVSAQSLGTVAAEEAARRKTVTAPAKVITDSDIKQGPTSPLIEPTPAAPAENPGPASLAVRTPARYRGGAAPQIPVMAVAGADVAVEATVSREGRVSSVARIRHSSPFTESVTAALNTWRFEPAIDAQAASSAGEGEPQITKTPVESRVLVIGLFRPPALFAGTIGTPPADVGRASDQVPFPIAPPMLPAMPPQVLADGVVLVELAIGPDGAITRATVVQSAPGFDQAALDAARAIRFRGARVRGQASPALAYVVAAFRQPITR